MKKNTKRILIFAIALPFIILLPDAHIYYERYKVRQNPLPKKYRGVAELQDLKDDIYEVKYYSIFSAPTMVNDSIVILNSMDKKSTDRGDVWTYKWFNINSAGKAIDSLKLVTEPGQDDIVTVNVLIVNTEKNIYSTWMQDGERKPKEIQNVAEGKIFSKSEAEDFAKDKKIISTTDADLEGKRKGSISKVFFLKDREIGYFYTDRTVATDFSRIC